MRRTTRRALGAVGTTLGLAFGLVGVVATPSSAQSPAEECAGLTYVTKFNFGDNGSWTESNDANNPGAVTLTETTAPGASLRTFSWTSTVPISRVALQAGGGSTPELVTNYDPAVTSGTIQWQTPPGISHITFCGGGSTQTPQTGSVTLDKTTSGNDQPAADTDFTFTVSCESGTETSPVTIEPDDAAVTVATGVSLGDDCTITETGTGGADSTSYTVNGNPGSNGTSQTVTVNSSTQAVAVVANNVFNTTTPSPETGSVTLDKTTSGNDQPAGTTPFTFTVECESGTETSPVTIEPDDAAVTVATGVAVGDDCTITETGTGGADSTSYTVNGSAGSSTASQTVTVSSDDQVVAVVADNVFNTTPAVLPTQQVATPAAPTAAPTAAVAGVQQTAPRAALPRTGSPSAPLMLIAGLLLTFGGMSLYGSTLPAAHRRNP